MSSKWWIVLGGILAVALGLAAKGQMQRYSAGPPPTVGEIQSLCVEEYPAPRNRTTVGLGEEVTCWIDPKSWRDVDVYIDAEGKQSEVADKMGQVVWWVDGAATVYPIVTDGSAVTVTADLADFNDSATVIATVRDSGTMGEDPPIQRRKRFNVIAPGGVKILNPADQPPGGKAGDGK